MSNEIRITPVQMDLGKIDPVKPREFWFSVYNDSDHDIMCAPWASCGCTTPVLLPSRIPAGGVSKLSATFDPVGKSGLQEKNIGVQYAKDGKMQSISVTFTAEV